MHRREILRLPLDGGIIPGYAQAPKLPSYRFKALVKDEMTGKETEEMLLVVDLSPDLTLHNLKADKELAEGCDLPTNLCLESTDRSRKPPPDTPSSGPGTAVGRGQEVNLRSVPDYDERLLETSANS
ncbi:hypothetical protein Bbelb_405690 [Branchiostoma belcheri]|nr:hypothetical protein Bbelb_405690 [Branchiostoma belcheri]